MSHRGKKRVPDRQNPKAETRAIQYGPYYKAGIMLLIVRRLPPYKARHSFRKNCALTRKSFFFKSRISEPPVCLSEETCIR